MRRPLWCIELVLVIVCVCIGTASDTFGQTEPVPRLGVSPDRQDIGWDGVVFEIFVTNEGGGVLNWTASIPVENVEFASLSTTSGVNDGVITGTIDRTKLSRREYRLPVNVTSNGGSEVVVVAFEVRAAGPFLRWDPYRFFIDLGVFQDAFTLTLTNEGLSQLDFEIRTEGSSWLSITPVSGNLDPFPGPGNSMEVLLIADRTGLEDGFYGDEMTIYSNGGSPPISVRMRVLTVPELEVTPVLLNFGPETQTGAFSIVNTGMGTLTWSVTSSEPWIEILPPPSGSGDATVEVRVDPAQVPPGEFQSGNIVVSSNGGVETVTVVYRPAPAAGAGKLSVYPDPIAIDCNIQDYRGVVEAFVVHTNTAGATGSQFYAPIAACMTDVQHLADREVFPNTIGDSQTGVTIGYDACLRSPIHVLTIVYFGQGRSETCCRYPLLPDPDAASGQIEVADCSGQVGFALGGFAYVNADGSCPCELTVPTQDRTWGGIKALYAPESDALKDGGRLE